MCDLNLSFGNILKTVIILILQIGIEDMLVISDVPKNTTTDSWFGALLKNAWATINAVLCGGFIAIECASVLVGIIFFHIWFITPYNVICAMLDLKRRCLVALYNIILSRCMKPISQLARVAAYILWGKQYDNI